MRIRIVLSFSLGLLFVSQTHAWNIGDLFSGMSTNVTPPGNFQDQAAGYYSGGGFSMRTRRGSFQPFSLTPPHMKMGCGPIDMFMGSFSAISGPHLVNMAKNIGTSAASYGFQLALKTFAPQIENLLKDLRNLAMELNEFAVKDCRAAQSIVASVLSKDSEMYEGVCKDLKRQNGGMDYFQAREGCEEAEDARAEANRFQKEVDDEVLLDNYNLFVIAATKAQIPEEMIQATMSIAGTLVMKDGKRRFFDSLVSDEDTFNAHLKGGTASLYECKDRDCLTIETLNNQEISAEGSYQGKSNVLLRAIKEGMLLNEGFKPNHKDFLSSIGEAFPIYNYLSLEVVTGMSIINKSSDLVATYLILHYMGKVIAEVKQAIQNLEGKQLNNQHFKEYLKRLDRVQDLLSIKHQGLMKLGRQMEKNARYYESHHMAKSR